MSPSGSIKHTAGTVTDGNPLCRRPSRSKFAGSNSDTAAKSFPVSNGEDVDSAATPPLQQQQLTALQHPVDGRRFIPNHQHFSTAVDQQGSRFPVPFLLRTAGPGWLPRPRRSTGGHDCRSEGWSRHRGVPAGTGPAGCRRGTPTPWPQSVSTGGESHRGSRVDAQRREPVGQTRCGQPSAVIRAGGEQPRPNASSVPARCRRPLDGVTPQGCGTGTQRESANPSGLCRPTVSVDAARAMVNTSP